MSDIAFVKGDKEKNFTILDNTCIRDENLSWGAKGLHCYLEHLPGDWKIYKSYLISHYPDKRVALNNLINELVDAGYIRVEKNLRNPDGTFAPQRYIVFEKPNNNQCRLSTADNTIVDNPLTENQHLLTTNKLNTDKQRTELTNPESETVSESVFVNIIKGLFGGEYPFDKNFESAVLKHLTDAGIEEANLEAYLKYVFERTKLGNVQKSFEGLFRKLALANSIIRDFKNSCFIKKAEEKQKSEQHIKYIDCPICSTRFKEFDFNCPICGVSVKEIKDQSQIDFIVKKKIYEMPDAEKEAYESAWNELTRQVKERTGRPFLLENEKIQFWKEYGILN